MLFRTLGLEQRKTSQYLELSLPGCMKVLHGQHRTTKIAYGLESQVIKPRALSVELCLTRNSIKCTTNNTPMDIHDGRHDTSTIRLSSTPTYPWNIRTRYTKTAAQRMVPIDHIRYLALRHSSTSSWSSTCLPGSGSAGLFGHGSGVSFFDPGYL